MRRAATTAVLALGLLASCSGPDPATGDAAGEGGPDAGPDGAADGGPDAVADGEAEGSGDTEAAGDGDPDAAADTEAPADGEPADAADTLDPDRRHQDLEHLVDEALRAALLARVAGHAGLGYDAARVAIFTDLDVHGGLVECVYTGLTVAADGTITPGTFNTEHSWPRSEGADAEPAAGDLHHLFPTDADANNRRGSHWFGETACSGAACDWAVGGSELGTVAGGADLVFEVRRQARGDIARAHFYFAVRYALPIPDAEEAFLRAWHAEDPPSVAEQARNDAIELLQGNRNPFVDRPDFVARLDDF